LCSLHGLSALHIRELAGLLQHLLTVWNSRLRNPETCEFYR
jgi:hypothetical protein